MGKIEWCKKQRKGIKIIRPEENISRAYFKKAYESLKLLSSINPPEWKIIISYYSCYYAFYALLMKVGIKSEIHECTIELMKFFDFTLEEIEFIKYLKNLRINVQYYTEITAPNVDINKVKRFVLKCEEISENIDIERLRFKIQQNE